MIFAIAESGVFVYNIHHCIDRTDYDVTGMGIFFSSYRIRFVHVPMAFRVTELLLEED